MTGRLVPASLRVMAEREHTERLLNAFFRETGRFDPRLDREEARGLLPLALMDGTDGAPAWFAIRLKADGAVLAGTMRRYSAMGHHRYGDVFWHVKREAGEPGRSEASFRKLNGTRDVAVLLLEELASPGEGAGQGALASLLERIDSSIGNACAYLEASDPEERPLAETHGMERVRRSEQSMLLGHPFHPAPKSSQGFDENDKARYAPELGASFVLHYFAVDPALMRERLLEETAADADPHEVAAEARARLAPEHRRYALIPAHPWQAGYLLRQPEVRRLIETGRLVHLGELGSRVFPTSSVRTVWDARGAHMLKLPLHVRITHFLRVNPTEQLERTIEASRVLAKLGEEHPFGDAFHIVIEDGYRTMESDTIGGGLSADFGVVYRRNPAAPGRALEDRDSPMVVASLLEAHPARRETPLRAFIRLAATDHGTVADLRFAKKWLARYAEISLVPLLWLYAKHGVSMEAHVQNSLVALDRGWPARFFVRDLEGTSLSAERAGSLSGLPADHPALYADEEAWKRLAYYVLVNHFGHVVHAIAHAVDADELPLWRTVYETIRDSAFLEEADLRRMGLFDDPHWPAKANLLSTVRQRGENPDYVPIPNLLYAVAEKDDAQSSADMVAARIASEKRQSPSQPYCAFLYDLDHLKRHASRLADSLPAFCQLFYAAKANSELPILRALANIVHGFETASAGEIRKAREADPAIPVIYGGPVKTDGDLAEALERKVRHIHAESAFELRRIDRIAGERGIVAPVLLRVNVGGSLPDATLFMAGAHSQFGIDERALPDVMGLARTLRHVRIEGFHLHSLSNNLSFEKHLELLAYYCGLVNSWMNEFGLEAAYLNAGGGIGVNYADLGRQFEWERFVRGLKERIAPLCPEGLTLVFECGRYIAASCGYYAAEVADVKSNHGSHFALLRGGTHHFRLPASWGHSHPFRVVPIEGWDYPFERPELAGCRVTLAGELCTPKDVLARDCRTERIRVGDVVLFPYAGAYGWAISHHDFLSHPHPRHVYIES
ncbi:IucA/IucC family protein [Paenibacillus arenilitoris]|uniref:Siderophore synthetase component n=1 Tax=Paenibacillus arenilitoris TaxID=2772299 RepID=A0A927CQT0_9BACL|nr:IucA/IucC family protein [Paenibacillus arenilitoris]MBD2870546.1 hypothetical protein [Paenibacillus arenilitoris]